MCVCVWKTPRCTQEGECEHAGPVRVWRSDTEELIAVQRWLQAIISDSCHGHNNGTENVPAWIYIKVSEEGFFFSRSFVYLFCLKASTDWMEGELKHLSRTPFPGLRNKEKKKILKLAFVSFVLQQIVANLFCIDETNLKWCRYPDNVDWQWWRPVKFGEDTNPAAILYTVNHRLKKKNKFIADCFTTTFCTLCSFTHK